MTTYRFRELTDEQVANWHNTPPAARKAAILEEMGMDSKEVLIESIQGNGGQLIAYISASGEREDLVEPLTASRGDHVRIYRGADGKLHGEIVPPTPKEPRYRRKPLEWVDEYDGQYVCTKSGVAYAWIESFDDSDFYWSLELVGKRLDGKAKTLEEAKARVEAEITRRLASVLEVCE